MTAPTAIITQSTATMNSARKPNSLHHLPLVSCQLRFRIPIGPSGSALATGDGDDQPDRQKHQQDQHDQEEHRHSAVGRGRSICCAA